MTISAERKSEQSDIARGNGATRFSSQKIMATTRGSCGGSTRARKCRGRYCSQNGREVALVRDVQSRRDCWQRQNQRTRWSQPYYERSRAVKTFYRMSNEKSTSGALEKISVIFSRKVFQRLQQRVIITDASWQKTNATNHGPVSLYGIPAMLFCQGWQYIRGSIIDDMYYYYY